LWGVETPAGTFTGRALVNAGGPAADDLARLCGVTPEFTVRRVRGSHIVVRKLFDHAFAYIFQLPDGRIVFAIPYEGEFTLIGTTDRDNPGSPFEVSASEDEIAYLCEAASEYFAQPVTPGDVVHSYAGVRALIDDGSGKPEAASRGYHLPLSPAEDGPPLLGVYGGKITSYRALAEEAVDALAERMGWPGEAWTAGTPLPGGDFPKEAQAELIAGVARAYPFLSLAHGTRIARAYGTRAGEWLGDAEGWGDLGRKFGAGLTEAEIGYLRREEWVQTAEDVLWRRSKLGLHMTAAERAEVTEYLGG
jgi:glycerol-3-phosphate dehydrogenase